MKDSITEDLYMDSKFYKTLIIKHKNSTRKLQINDRNES